MYDITFRRIVLTADGDVTLRMMKGRTGLTPNILCRIALTVSLDEPGLPRLVNDDEKSLREINRYTLLGEYDVAFMALVKARLSKDGIEPAMADDYFVAHVHRGISLLPNRIRSIADMRLLCPG